MLHLSKLSEPNDSGPLIIPDYEKTYCVGSGSDIYVVSRFS